MTTREKFNEMLSTLSPDRRKFNGLVMAAEWLEDINFHAECKELVTKSMDENERGLYELLGMFDVCSRRNQFSPQHWEAVAPPVNICKAYESLVEKGHAVADGYIVTASVLYDFRTAVATAKVLSRWSGYGIDGSLPMGAELAETLAQDVKKSEAVIA